MCCVSTGLASAGEGPMHDGGRLGGGEMRAFHAWQPWLPSCPSAAPPRRAALRRACCAPDSAPHLVALDALAAGEAVERGRLKGEPVEATDLPGGVGGVAVKWVGGMGW